jgi:Uncharacterised conserved protein
LEATRDLPEDGNPVIVISGMYEFFKHSFLSMNLPDSFLSWTPASDTKIAVLKSDAHKEGLWNGIINISITEISCQQLSLFTQSALTLLQEQDVILDLIPSQHWHISLSKHFKLSHRYIQPFIDTFRSNLGTMALSPKVNTTINVSRIVVLESMESLPIGTTFFTFKISDDTLCPFLSAANKTMREFGLDTYYDPPIMHISFASTFSSVPKNLKLSLYTDLKFITLKLQDINIKIGNKTYSQATSL